MMIDDNSKNNNVRYMYLSANAIQFAGPATRRKGGNDKMN